MLDLAPDQNFLSFMFSVLDYTAPEQNTYRYRLDGLDTGWINAGTRHYAAYTDLQPGDYVFRFTDATTTMCGTPRELHSASG